MRICSVCHTSKEDHCFSVIRRNEDGSIKYRNSWCDDCKRDKHRTKHGIIKRPARVITEFTKGCTKCGQAKDNSFFSPKASWCNPCKNEAQIVRNGGRVKPIPVVTETHKECLECHIQKVFTEFSPSVRGRAGRSAYCKPCATLRVRNSEAYKDGASTRATQRWRSINPEVHRAQHRLTQFKRRTGIKAVDDGTLTPEVLRGIYAKEYCYWCKGFIESVDRTLEHIVELSQGGIHGISNVDMACRSCNSSRKGRK